MLSDQAYVTALWTYIGAASLALLCTAWWLRRSWRPLWIALLVLLGAAVLLTPAYPEPGLDTMAPALIVAAFQILTNDLNAARHALLPLGAAVVLALVLAILLRLLLFRRPRAVSATGSNRDSSRV